MPRKTKRQIRNETIFDLCEAGLSFSKVADQFDLSVSRVRQLYYDKKGLPKKLDSMSPFQKKLSPRSQNRLRDYFGGDIFDHPERIVDFGVFNLGKIKNVGIKVMGEISKALHEMGYLPVDEVKIWLADWSKGKTPAKPSDPITVKKNLRRATPATQKALNSCFLLQKTRIKALTDHQFNQNPHLGQILLNRYAERLLSGFEDLERFELINQLKKPVMSFRFYGSKRIILEVYHFLTRFQYSFVIFTKQGPDIWSLPERGNRNAQVYISRFPKLIKFIQENNNNISEDLWGLLYGYPLDEIYDYVYRKDVLE